MTKIKNQFDFFSVSKPVKSTNSLKTIDFVTPITLETFFDNNNVTYGL